MQKFKNIDNRRLKHKDNYLCALLSLRVFLLCLPFGYVVRNHALEIAACAHMHERDDKHSRNLSSTSMPPPARSAYMLKLKSGNETTRFAPRARRYYNKAGLHATVAAICRPDFSGRKHRNAIRTSLYCGTDS